MYVKRVNTRKAHKLWDWGRRCHGQISLLCKHIANPLNNLVSNYYVHSAARSWGFVHGWKVAANNQKLTHDFTMSINSKCCSFCRSLAGIPVSNYAPTFGGRGFSRPRESKTIPIEVSTPHSNSTSIHNMAHLAPFGHNTLHGRETTERSEKAAYPMASAT